MSKWDFDGNDFNRLVEIVSQLADFSTESARIAFVNRVLSSSPRKDDIIKQLDLSGNPQNAATSLIIRLKKFGQDVQGREAIAILVNRILDSVGFGDDEKFLRQLFEKYPLDKPISRSSRIDDWRGTDDFSYIQEKIIGENTLMDLYILQLALDAARSVVRIRTPREHGSGFMISPTLLMTNHHVIKSHEIANKSEFDFNYELTASGESTNASTCSSASDGIFYSNSTLDFTVVELSNPPSSFSPLKLVSKPVSRDERINIIQHPGGYYKKISMQNNFVEYSDGTVLQYTASTEPGSSGSPVFNELFEVVAIHHSGGSLIEPRTKRKYFRNEGIAMLAVLRDLQANKPEILDSLNL